MMDNNNNLILAHYNIIIIPIGVQISKIVATINHLKFVLYQKTVGTLWNPTGFKHHKCILSQFIKGRKCLATLTHYYYALIIIILSFLLKSR